MILHYSVTMCSELIRWPILYYERRNREESFLFIWAISPKKQNMGITMYRSTKHYYQAMS